MASLVEELQRDALNPQVRVSDLLRKAKAIAHKLDLPDLAVWVENELNGYPDTNTPKYRVFRGRLQLRHPLHGGWESVPFSDAEDEEAFARLPLRQKVAEIEDLIVRSTSGEMMIPLSSQAKQALAEVVGINTDFRVLASATDLAGILDAVRNALLDWSLKLEKAGIKGEGMSFSTGEREKAHEPQVIYNIGTIGTFTGNMGSGSGTFSVDGNLVNSEARADIQRLVDQVEVNKAALKLPAMREKELDTALAGLRAEIGNAQPNGGKVRGFLTTLRAVAEGVTGSLVAQGILFELGKLLR